MAWAQPTQFIAIDGAVYWLEHDRDPAQLTEAWNSAVSAAGQMGL